ncbi:hypothetical protein CRE_23043 [Caenorhabditis remanei]|uniref:F-box associated domain-containing protein n=1 Tax=Caenorhabditis remanei TaxID=31234 RepID=E3N4H9_CAERE|nr:hypothetical protein CRE_23043 [Caenorhabditis remanei]
MRSFRINFSMISKRAKAVTKQITFYSTYSIQLSIDDQFELWVVVPRYMTSCFYKFTSNVEMNGKVKKIDWNDRNELFTWKYSDKPGEEWKQLCTGCGRITRTKVWRHKARRLTQFWRAYYLNFC